MSFDAERSIEVTGYGRRRRGLFLAFAFVVVAAIAGVLMLLPDRAPAQTLDPMNIAVLPFVSLSEPPDEEFFVDGLSEEIMRALGSVADIRVVAKTSSFGFRKSKADARAIGRQLNAGSVLEGTVRREVDAYASPHR